MLKLGIISLDHPHAVGNHIPALKYLSDKIKVAGIFHDDQAVAGPFVRLLGAEYFSSRDDLLSRADIDAVLITSKNSNHMDDCIASAKAGKDIFCDKPIAISVEEARNIVDAVKKYNVKFLTTFPVRFNPAVMKLKQMIDDGVLGEIKAIMATNHGCMYEPDVPAWVKNPRENGGGCLIDHTVHVADVIRWITNDDFQHVKAETQIGAVRDLEAEDLAVLHGEMRGGALYQIDASWSRRGDNPMWGDVTFRVIGSKSSATLDLYNNHQIEVYSNGKTELLYPNLIVKDHGEVFLDYWRHMEAGEALVGADETDGMRTIELVFAAYKSAETGNRVSI